MGNIFKPKNKDNLDNGKGENLKDQHKGHSKEEILNEIKDIILVEEFLFFKQYKFAPTNKSSSSGHFDCSQ